MNLGVTFCFYLVIGAAVAIALWITDAHGTSSTRVFQSVTALLFWPLYLPVLLSSNGSLPTDLMLLRSEISRETPPDDLTCAIIQVELELDSAVRSLMSWDKSVLGQNCDRLSELRRAWRQQAERIREMDALLVASAKEATPVDTTPTETPRTGAPLTHADLISISERSRQKNLSRLKVVREESYDNLMATLACVRQLVTMIHLARYTREPASRAAELVQQIADAVDGLTQVAP